jgi:tyrosine-protein kinase Etk/Wzc
VRAPQSLVGQAATAPVMRRAWLRRTIVVVLVAVCALMTLFPERYRATMSLTPADPSSLGLGGTLGQLGALNSVFGNQSAIEVSVKVATSAYVRDKVAARLKLDERLGLSRVGTLRWLARNVDIRTLRGGIIQFETELRDAEFGREIVATYGEAVRAQLGIIARNQTGYKRQILVNLVAEASDRLQRAQAAYDSFRLETRYSQPSRAINAIGERIPMIEEEIKSKQVQLNAARQFATDDNMSVRQIVASIEALQGQLAQARETTPTAPESVGRVVRQSTQADRLRRDLDIAQGLYDSYRRFLQGTSVEDLTSTANVRVLEPAYIDPARQYNLTPMLAGIIILLLGLAIEFYNLRPPIEARVPA